MNILEFIATMPVDEHYVQSLAHRLEKMADGYEEMLREIPVLNEKLDTLAESLKDVGKVAQSIPILLERQERMAKETEARHQEIRMHEIKLTQMTVFQAELVNLKRAVYGVFAMIGGLLLLVLKHVFPF